jgi:flagellar protein FliL
MSSLTGIKIVDTIITALALLASLICLSTIIYSGMIFEKELPQDTIERLKMLEEVKGTTYPESYKLEKITVNLKSRRNKLRYLDTTIHLVPFNSKYNDVLDNQKSEILDIIIDVSGKMSPDEINSLLGKLLYENRLKTRINKILKKEVVKDIYFSKFTVQ